MSPHRSLHLVPLLAAGLLLAACTLGPDYQRPEAPLPAAFKHEQGWRTVPPRSWEASGEWWLAFDDPVLTGLLDQAAAANQTLAQAEARFRAAEARWADARAGYSPVLSASVEGQRRGSDQSRSVVTGSTVRSGRITESYGAGLNLNWMPDLWGRVRRQVEAERAGLQASAADLAAVRLSMRVSLAQSYVRLRALDRQMALLGETMETYDRSLELTRNQYNAGIVARSDVIQARTQAQSLRTELSDLRNQRAAEENAIAVLIGRAPSDFGLAPVDRLPELPVLPATLPAVLISRRPDVVAAERQVASANAGIGVARAAWLPDLTLTASYGVEADRFSDLVNAPVRVWSVGPSLAQTLFDGGARRAANDLALAGYDEQVALYRQTVLESLREVEDALAALRYLDEQGEQQEALLALARDNLRVVTNRYRAGMVTFLEVATAQDLELDARRARVRILADRLNASIALAAALGGGWDLDDPVVQTVVTPPRPWEDDAQ
ncbi:efflux transporter outer membrane subunit [Alloalcanivorax gelatiniphagus]|uniref:Efflux transporter outer membrane subunit n=2 Tax=Alloalcanivorax gelatiniphagus TaxID=1194167 RepID=A0ABY2XG37_9GAMM|nr:efflux transporter outer membrane subunit [Alloalcanivorax gelatiniphagus]